MLSSDLGSVLGSLYLASTVFYLCVPSPRSTVRISFVSSRPVVNGLFGSWSWLWGAGQGGPGLE